MSAPRTVEEVVAILNGHRDLYDPMDAIEFVTLHGLSAVPVVENLDESILAMVEGERAAGALNMITWHCPSPRTTIAGKKCGTTHCRAGWAIALGGRLGWALERSTRPSVAGALIYAVSAGYVPSFYTGNVAALNDIRDRASMAASDVAAEGK